MRILQFYSIDKNGFVTDQLAEMSSIRFIVTIDLIYTSITSDINIISSVPNPNLIKYEELKKFYEDYIYPIISLNGDLSQIETENHLEFHCIVSDAGTVYGKYVKLLKDAYKKYCDTVKKVEE